MKHTRLLISCLCCLLGLTATAAPILQSGWTTTTSSSTARTALGIDPLLAAKANTNAPTLFDPIAIGSLYIGTGINKYVQANEGTNIYFAVQQGKFIVEPAQGFELRAGQFYGHGGGVTNVPQAGVTGLPAALAAKANTNAPTIWDAELVGPTVFTNKLDTDEAIIVQGPDAAIRLGRFRIYDDGNSFVVDDITTGTGIFNYSMPTDTFAVQEKGFFGEGLQVNSGQEGVGLVQNGVGSNYFEGLVLFASNVLANANLTVAGQLVSTNLATHYPPGVLGVDWSVILGDIDFPTEDTSTIHYQGSILIGARPSAVADLNGNTGDVLEGNFAMGKWLLEYNGGDARFNFMFGHGITNSDQSGVFLAADSTGTGITDGGNSDIVRMRYLNGYDFLGGSVRVGSGLVVSNVAASSIVGTLPNKQMTNIIIGANLSFDGTTLSATGGGDSLFETNTTRASSIQPVPGVTNLHTGSITLSNSLQFEDGAKALVLDFSDGSVGITNQNGAAGIRLDQDGIFAKGPNFNVSVDGEGFIEANSSLRRFTGADDQQAFDFSVSTAPQFPGLSGTGTRVMVVDGGGTISANNTFEELVDGNTESPTNFFGNPEVGATTDGAQFGGLTNFIFETRSITLNGTNAALIKNSKSRVILTANCIFTNWPAMMTDGWWGNVTFTNPHASDNYYVYVPTNAMPPNLTNSTGSYIILDPFSGTNWACLVTNRQRAKFVWESQGDNLNAAMGYFRHW